MKIAILSSHTSSLFWFRMDMMKDFIEKGHDVIAVGPDSEEKWKERFNLENIIYKQIYVERNGVSPIGDLKTYRDLFQFMKIEKPDKVFTYQAKTIVYGSLAAKLNGITEIYPLVAGLGSIFRGEGLKNKIIKAIMKLEYRMAFKTSKRIFFQNHDDKNEFIRNGLVKEGKTIIINGSGVNLKKFKPKPLPDNPTFLFIGRLIKDKGVIEYLEACKRIKSKYSNVRCLLVGPYDSNPTSLQPEELQTYIDNEIIEYFGEQSDVRPFIAECSTYVLPSYHEGTPKTVLESMAMGRSILTSDAPGCRETVIDGDNGYLVKVKDIESLVDKMEYLISHPELNRKMGEKSLKIAKEKYDVKIINQTIMKSMGLL